MPFDVQQCRVHFPALQQKQVFFDNAGGSQTLGTVISSISDYLSNTNVQMGATYTVGKESSRKYGDGCEAAAKYINASRDEIVLGPSTTQLFRNLSTAIKWQEGDEIILSKIDHEANIAPWVSIVDLLSHLNLKISWWSPAPETNPNLDPEELRQLMTPKTKLVCCTHTSNILGTINPIRQIAEVVHETPGAMLCVDGVAYAPHRPIDVKDLGMDWYAFSWYKVYGPHIAMLYGDKETQRQIGTLGHYFNPDETLEQKLGLAGASYELAQSIPAVVEYTRREGFWDGVREHEAKLAEILLSYLRSREDVTIYGEVLSDPRVRVPTVSFAVKGWGSREIVETVEKECHYGFRWGHFYSERLCDDVLQVGEEGVVRISLVHYNTEKEIKVFVEAFDRILVKR